MHVKALVAGITLAVLTGCGTLQTSQKPQKQEAGSAAHVKCGAMKQPGCFEVRPLNFKFDERHRTTGLDKPYASQEERQRRAQYLAPESWEGYRAGHVQVSERKRSFLVMFWGINPVPAESIAAYRIDGASNEFRHTVAKVTVEDVTGKVPVPVAETTAAKLGQPQKVYRIRADGPIPLGASLQFPWSMTTDRTYSLTCAEEGGTVYPNSITSNQGLWVTPETYNWLRDVKKSRRTLQVFLSKE